MKPREFFAERIHLLLCHWDWFLNTHNDYVEQPVCILITVQQDATQSSLFVILQVHSTCFRCQPHPSSGAHKSVTTASGTGHIFCAATSLQRGQASFWPRREVAAQYQKL